MRVLAALLALALAPAASAGQTLVDRVIEAYGGADAIRAVDGYRQEGMLVARNGGGHGQVYRIATAQDVLSVLVDYPGRTEIRIVERERGWRGPSPSELEEVRGPLLQAMVAQAARAWIPRILVDRHDEIVEGPMEGRNLVLVVPVAEGLELRLVVDPVSRYVVRSESVFLDVPGPMGFATDYSDFRPVNGVTFAFREETFASGVHTASLVLSEIEINPSGARATLPRIY